MPRFQRTVDSEAEEPRATALELFYDLVFVFAVTQVSNLLLSNLSWEGAGQALIVLLVIWWAWNYTTWVTNELDPDSSAVRLLLIALMLASMLMAVAIPNAFGDLSLLFAVSYVAIQVGRHLFLTFVSADPQTIERERAGRILTWFVAAGVLWIAGALAGSGARTALWLGALAIDYGGPLVLFWVPRRQRLDPHSWEVQTSHFTERFGLFIIIALGESIVITGATTSDLGLTPARGTALSVALLSTAALWWLYFSYVARIAERRLELAGDDRTTLARDAYTYLHVVLVAGVIVSAVGDELVIAHPSGRLASAELLAVAGGPAIYLLAHALFRLRVAGTISWRRLAGAAGCLVLAALGSSLPALVVAALMLTVVSLVIASEQLAARQRDGRGEPSPLERLEQSFDDG